MKKIILCVLIAFWACFPVFSRAQNARLDTKEIDSQLETMRASLPANFASGITWVDVSRNKDRINYTYIVNADSAEWSDDERLATISQLQDFGCRQLMPAMCEGSKPMFDAGLVAVTTYHDSFGNYLFDCTFTPEACQKLFAHPEDWLGE